MIRFIQIEDDRSISANSWKKLSLRHRKSAMQIAIGYNQNSLDTGSIRTTMDRTQNEEGK
ncbi:MAG TPA: hypothetical protein VKZ56_02835 [Membranihabitans sp.]|nr:hypothetical protein [Membranihabitans sp.]